MIVCWLLAATLHQCNQRQYRKNLQFEPCVTRMMNDTFKPANIKIIDELRRMFLVRNAVEDYLTDR
jgi:hypothetical protein